MPLHNTEELKSGPTSQIESEVHNAPRPTPFEVSARKSSDYKPSTRPSTSRLILDGNSP